MNRFPAHYNERPEQKLCCHACDQPLTESESDHYWQRFPLGQHEPYCFDCASQIDIEEVTRKREPMRLIPAVLFAGAVTCLAMAIYDSKIAGAYLMGAAFCGSWFILSKICKW